MNINWEIIIFGIGFALIIESVIYTASPKMIKEVAKQILMIDDKIIRYIGIIVFIVGVLFLILYKYLRN